jgi:HAD superfamily hydrolase (TIGR01450 family)
MDGTVNKGSTLVLGAKTIYEELSARGIQWLFLSNNGSRLPRDLAKRLNDIGLPVLEGQMINSVSALILGLQKEFPSARVMVVGENRLVEGLKEAGVHVVEDGDSAVDCLVTAIDRTFTYEKLRMAQAALLGGALFWATNTDASLPVENGFMPGAGSIVAAISVAAGRGPDRIFGKPSVDMAQIALDILRLAPDDCLVVGDRMETDILFGRNAGIDTALVLTGATSRSDLPRFPFAPDYVLESIGDMGGLFGAW